MPRTTQLTLSLVSRPGTLAALARTLADAGVNITALSAASKVAPTARVIGMTLHGAGFGLDEVEAFNA